MGSQNGLLVAPSNIRWGNQNYVVTVRFVPRVWRYDLSKIEKTRSIMLEKILSKQTKLTFSSHKIYQTQVLQRDLKQMISVLGRKSKNKPIDHSWKFFGFNFLVGQKVAIS
jgi:uncharacterized lipoprotein YbaY